MIKKCKSCRTEIDEKVRICPHCKAAQNWLSRNPILTGLVILFIILGILGIAHVISKNADSSNQVQLDQNQPSPTNVRHDNSGADIGGDTSIQGHMQRALQHFGL